MTATRTGLVRSRDRKVTNLPSPNGKTAQGANAFGLPSGLAFSCPGATSICERVCYAGKLEKIYKGVRDILMHNWNLLSGASVEVMADLILAMVQDFVDETLAQRAKSKPATFDFRIHWDGDFFSTDYAEAWAAVIRLFPYVRFWVYTRSFTSDLNVVPILAGIENLSLYLSADADNVVLANEIAQNNPGVMIATLAQTFAEARETIVDSTRKGYNCPEIDRRTPLITAKGSACIRCNVCPSGKGDVFFSIGKK
jgi:hypothetical protein